MKDLTAAIQQMNEGHKEAAARREVWRGVAPNLKEHLVAIAKEVNAGLGENPHIRLIVQKFDQPGKLLELQIGFGRTPTGASVRRPGNVEGLVVERGATLVFQSDLTGKVVVFAIDARLEFPGGPAEPAKGKEVEHVNPEKLNDPTFVKDLVGRFVLEAAKSHWTRPGQAESLGFKVEAQREG